MPSDQVSKRLANQNSVLRALHFEGPLRRGQLSDKLAIRKSSITSIVAELLRAGLVREDRPDSARSTLSLDREHWRALAASVTADRIEFATVHLDGHLENRSSRPVPAGTPPDQVIGLLAEGMRDLLSRKDGKTLGAGVATPGIVNPTKGLCLRAVNLNRWHNVPLGPALGAQLGFPVHVDNDVRCQLLACTWFDRLARDAENVIYVHIHDGVACAIMTHGLLLHGERFAAGEIGHIRIGDEGRLCTCGRTDCVETYCSLPAVRREMFSIRPAAQLDTAAAIVAAAAEDAGIANVLDRMTRRLARAIGGLVAAIDPSTLVLGTVDRRLSDLLRPMLERHLYDELIGLQVRDADIRTVDDVGTSSLRGAAAMAVAEAFASGRFEMSAPV